MLASPEPLPQQLQVLVLWFTGELLSLPWYFCLTGVFYLDFRGVSVVARWVCGRGLALGLSPVTGSLACVFFSPLFVIQIMSVSAVYLDILGG